MHPTSTNSLGQLPQDSARLNPEASSEVIWHSPVGIFTSTPEGRFTFANPAMARIYGYPSPAELIASITDISSQIYVYPEEREIFQKEMREQGELINQEYRHLRRDGSVIWVSLNARAIYDEHGELLHYQGFSTDITERKNAASFIESRERYLQKVLDTCGEGFWVINAKGFLQEVNQTYCAMSGYSREELLGLAIRDLDAIESPDETAARVNRIKARGAEIFETEHSRKDGTIYPVEIAVTWLDQDGGQMVCFCRDISDRKSAAEALVTEHTRLENIIEATQIGTWEWNVQSGKTIFNKRWAAIIGYTLAELTPVSISTWEKFVHPDDLVQRTNLLVEHFTGEKVSFDFESRMRHKDGHWVWVREQGRVISRTEDGQPLLMFGTHTDITNRKVAEDALAASHALLKNLARLVPGVIYQYRLYPDGRSSFPYSSPGMQGIYGVTPDAVREDATPAFDRLHPDDRDRVTEAIFASARTLQAFYCEFRVALPQQGLRWRWCQAHPQRLEDGSTLWHGIISDITERKQAEEQLQKSEQEFRDLYDEAPVGYFEYDLRGNITRVNHTLLKSLGYTTKEMIGQPCWKFIVDEVAREQIMAKLDGVRPPAVGLERTYRRKDGTTFPVLFEDRLLLDEDGHIKGIRTAIQDITERKQAEDVLRKNEKDLRETQRIAHVGSWRLDVATNQVVWTEELYNMYGFDPSLPPPPYTEHMKLFTPESWERLSTALARTRDTGIPYTLELETLRKDGSNGWMWVRGEADVDSAGKTVGLWGAAQDITARKRAETYRDMGREILQILNEPGDLQESIQRVLTALKTRTGLDAVGLRLQEGEDFPYFVQDGFSRDFLLTENTLTERGKDGGVCRDKDGNIRLECTCGLVISGKTDASNPLFTKGGSSWTNDSFPLLDLPSDQDPRLHPRNNCIHQGYASVALIPIRTSDRTVGLIQLNDKRKGRFTLELVEILEVIAAHVGSALIRKQVEEDLEKSLSLIEATMNTLEEGLLVVDMEGKVIRHNRAFLDLWKIPPDLETSSDEILLDHVVSQPVDPAAFLSKVRQLYDTPEASSFDEIAFADGRVFERYSRPQWQGSQITGRVWCFRDITERKQAEEVREELQAQLLQAQKMESVGRLAGGVAHDFNNMLGVILGHIEIALEDVDPGVPLHASLRAAQHAAERSAALTRQLLAFARKQTVAPEVIDINDTVEGMLKMLRRLIGEDIDLIWQPGRNLKPVKVDPSQIDQLLANLCVNSRDAITGVGKVTIETDAKTFDEDYCTDHLGFLPGEYLLLEVSDDGSGMDKKTLSHIFEPFFTTKEQGKGTGLGLASVFGMVQQNKGFINVDSEPGQGTTFKIYLPAYTEKSAGVVEKAPDLPAEQGNETILLVEDEPAILEMATMMLTRLGYTVVAAATPGDAVRLAHEYRGRIDLLMTDVVMPAMNGRELAGNLLSHYPNLKRLFMSGYTANVIAHHGVLDEGVHFIQKPFSMKDLGGKLREAMEG